MKRGRAISSRRALAPCLFDSLGADVLQLVVDAACADWLGWREEDIGDAPRSPLALWTRIAQLSHAHRDAFEQCVVQTARLSALLPPAVQGKWPAAPVIETGLGFQLTLDDPALPTEWQWWRGPISTRRGYVLDLNMLRLRLGATNATYALVLRLDEGLQQCAAGRSLELTPHSMSGCMAGRDTLTAWKRDGWSTCRRAALLLATLNYVALTRRYPLAMAVDARELDNVPLLWPGGGRGLFVYDEPRDGGELHDALCIALDDKRIDMRGLQPCAAINDARLHIAMLRGSWCHDCSDEELLALHVHPVCVLRRAANALQALCCAEVVVGDLQ